MRISKEGQVNSMSPQHDSSLVRLQPRADTIYISQDRTVLATERDGFIRDGAEHGPVRA